MVQQFNMVKSEPILLHILLTVSAEQLANSIHTGEVIKGTQHSDNLLLCNINYFYFNNKDFMYIGSFDERHYFISPNAVS